jgi:pyruvate dehydrogenase E2 component (dihydrolipoamide acetyltransferase)
MTSFLMPSLGADMEDGTLVEWKKKPGDILQYGDIIAEVDTQKGLIEIEVFEEGILENILVEEGQKVPVGTPMAYIKTKEETSETVPEMSYKPRETHPIVEKEATEKPLEVKEAKSAEIPPEPVMEAPRIKISPLAKRIAREKGIDLSKLTGTGEQGGITREDVERYMAAGEAALEKQPDIPSKSPSLTAIRNAVAAAMSKSNQEIPHYYLEKKVDMTAAMIWLKETNAQREIKSRLLPATLFLKAVGLALKKVPELNAHWENGLQIQEKIAVGFVVSLREGGLVVPAIHQPETKSMDELMEILNELIPRARSLRLRSSELSDTTITVTSLGEGGADKVFGVIYPPQVALVGFGSVIDEVIIKNNQSEPRKVIYITLAGDHRATDGLTGSRFLNSLDHYLQNPEKL